MADSQRKTANLLSFEELMNAPSGQFKPTSTVADHMLELQLKPNTKYTMSSTGTGSSAGDADTNRSLYFTATQVDYCVFVNHDVTVTSDNSGKLKVGFYSSRSNAQQYINGDAVIMLNEGSTALPYEPHWKHSLRKLTTAIEDIETPLYSDGTAITAYTIKGNTETSGTPSPQNPVTINGTGNKTANLTLVTQANSIYYSNNNNYTVSDNIVTVSGSALFGFKTKVSPNTEYTVQGNSTNLGTVMRIREYSSEPTIWGESGTGNYITQSVNQALSTGKSATFTTTENTQYVLVVFYANSARTIYDIMLSEGSTSKTYEPYGYKISISSNGTALTPIYLSQQLLKVGDYSDDVNSSGTVTRLIRKIVLDGTEDWYFFGSAKPSEKPYDIYQFYTYGLTLGGIQYSSCISNIADYGMTASTRYDNNYGVYMISSGADVAFQMEGSKAQFPDVEAWKQYLATQYATGTPVTVWYQLSTPTTETVTVPEIPTTDGANTITVDTTVQPSEFTATWTGWHDSSVKEYDGTDWQ